MSIIFDPPRPITQYNMRLILLNTNNQVTQDIYAFFLRTSFDDITTTYIQVLTSYSTNLTPGPGLSLATVFRSNSGFIPSLLTILFQFYVNIAWNIQGDSYLDQVIIYTYNVILLLESFRNTTPANAYADQINYLLNDTSDSDPTKNGLLYEFKKLLVYPTQDGLPPPPQ